MKKVKLTLDCVEEKLKLTKDGTHNFVDTAHFKKLIENRRYLISTRHNNFRDIFEFENL